MRDVVNLFIVVVHLCISLEQRYLVSCHVAIRTGVASSPSTVAWNRRRMDSPPTVSLSWGRIVPTRLWHKIVVHLIFA